MNFDMEHLVKNMKIISLLSLIILILLTACSVSGYDASQHCAPVLTHEETSNVVETVEPFTATAISDDTSSMVQISAPDLEAFAHEVFALTNIEREAVGLHPFEHDKELAEAAQIRANEIVEYFSHSRPDGGHFSGAFVEADVIYSQWGENLANGQKNPDEAIAMWMESDSHRAAMLSHDYHYMGVGVCVDESGKLFWVQTFRG